MEIIALIILLFWVDPMTFDVTHDTGQPLIGHAVQQVCEAGDGTYTAWGSDAGCADFSIPK